MTKITRSRMAWLLISLVSVLGLATTVEAARNTRSAWATIDDVTTSTFVISYGYEWQGAGAYRVIVRDTTTGDTCSLQTYPDYSTFEYLLNGTTSAGTLDVQQTDISTSLCHQPPDPTHHYTLQFDVWQVGKNGKVRLLAQQLDYWPTTP